MAAKTIKFDKAIIRLEEIVQALENNEEDLEHLLILFEEGSKLLKNCKKQLQSFENKLEILNEKESASLPES
jgi:exodeoxyribonuclease VII small subunit